MFSIKVYYGVLQMTTPHVHVAKLRILIVIFSLILLERTTKTKNKLFNNIFKVEKLQIVNTHVAWGDNWLLVVLRIR